MILIRAVEVGSKRGSEPESGNDDDGGDYRRREKGGRWREDKRNWGQRGGDGMKIVGVGGGERIKIAWKHRTTGPRRGNKIP